MKDGPLRGKAALVTGGGRRLGAAIVERLAAAGCPVALHSHGSAAAARQAAARLRRRGATVAVVPADLRHPAAARELVADAATALGMPIRLLVNNAASFDEATMDSLTWEQVSESLRLDAWAPFELTRRLAAQMPARGHGAVVNVLDARIADYDWDHVGYFLAKRMLSDLTRLCAVHVAPRITVNGVAPGPVLAPPGDRAFLRRMERHLPLRRTPRPAEVAEAVAHLLASPSTTGQVLFVDGGRHLGRAVYA